MARLSARRQLNRHIDVERDAQTNPGMTNGHALQTALAGHLSEWLGSTVSIDDFQRKSQGFSWITYAFVARSPTGQSRKLILRLAPENGLFAPYSVLPQVRALQLVSESAVPVPKVIGFSVDGGQIGHPFFVCEHIDGDTPAPWSASSVSQAHRCDIARQFIGILGDLHQIAWQGSALAALHAERERPEVAAIAAWRRTLARPTARYYPLLDWGGEWLERNCPTPACRAVVHGDYRIGNFLEQDSRITAILDWELTHIGDPHEDLAWALMPTFNAGSRKFYGVVEHDDMIRQYESVSGLSVSRKSIAFYQAYALYQAAAIQMCAIHAFEVDRFNDMRMAVMGSQMASIVRAFDRALEAAA